MIKSSSIKTCFLWQGHNFYDRIEGIFKCGSCIWNLNAKVGGTIEGQVKAAQRAF